MTLVIMLLRNQIWQGKRYKKSSALYLPSQSEVYMKHKTAVKYKWSPYTCIYISYASDSNLQNSSGSSFIIKAITW